MMSCKFIYEKKNAISDELCDKIILYYENSNYKKVGVTRGGLNKSVKDTVDLTIPLNNVLNEESIWININDKLYKSLYDNLVVYINEINPDKYYKLFNSDYLYESTFMIQKYDKCKGKYTYHNDSSINPNFATNRVITYIWYLNDILEGGETEFWGNYKIKPEKGKLVLFPASWTFPHCGKMPISDDKYIITGWLYNENFRNQDNNIII
jgi:hypothetical protein